MKRLLPLLLLLVLAPAFALKASWQTRPVGGKPAHVAITNLVDVAFNNQGQIVGWYIKRVKGEKLKGNFEKATDLVKSGLPLPGTLEGFSKPNSSFTHDGKNLVASFQQGGTRLIYRISPYQYTLDVSIKNATPTTISFSGIDGSNRPLLKLLPKGKDQPEASGTAPAAYASLQTEGNKGMAIIVEPVTPLSVALKSSANGAMATVALPAGEHQLRVYGGQNELVRLHVEHYLNLPGLFHPNIWGTLSLGLIYVMEFSYKLVHNWGLAILLMTLFVRLLLWPLMHQQLKSMAEMNKLKPLMDEINKKHKGDAEKRNKATMQLYQEHKVNPASGCLPLVVQMPILFVLWRVIANYEFGQGFLWLPDLSLPDPYYILPVLYVLVMIGQTLLSAHGNRQMIQQGLIMNLVFIFLVLSFPAGVTLYWVFSTLIGLVQQMLINRSLGTAKPVKAG